MFVWHSEYSLLRWQLKPSLCTAHSTNAVFCIAISGSHPSHSPGSGCKPRPGLGGCWRFEGLSGEPLNTRLVPHEPTLTAREKERLAGRQHTHHGILSASFTRAAQLFCFIVHLDEAEADHLFGQAGVELDVWLRLHHRFILINGFLIPDCTQRENSPFYWVSYAAGQVFVNQHW